MMRIKTCPDNLEMVTSDVSEVNGNPPHVGQRMSAGKNFWEQRSDPILGQSLRLTTSKDSSDAPSAQSGLLLSTFSSVSKGSEKTYGHDLPRANGWKFYQWLRWNWFSSYRRLFTTVFAVNLGMLIDILVKTDLTSPSLSFRTLTATSINLAVSVASRNEHIVNLLFLISSSLPVHSPLFIRRLFAKIYTYGGIHSGCATAAVLWYVGYAVSATYHIWNPPFVELEIMVFAYINLAILLLISLFALPAIRTRLHDWFECIHRFAGWTVIACFWAQGMMIARKKNTAIAAGLIHNPSFWCLVTITACISYPWIRLRSRMCSSERLSKNVSRFYFDHPTPPYCSAVRVATNPLKETHPFAAIPYRGQDSTGFSLIVSDAGDWTKRIICQSPPKLFIKGGPLFGVLRVAAMFKPILIVATGSGIGPCLSLFHGVPDLDCRILWSASNPLATYGENVVGDVLRADPTATIVDTSKRGRPDLVKLTYTLWRTNDCEAVVVISNQNVTSEVVYEMEIRGVPTYGPIFDS